MLRVFLLLCLISQENLAYTTKIIPKRCTKTLPSGKQNKTNHAFGKILVNTAILVKFINSASGRSAVLNKTSINKLTHRKNVTSQNSFKGTVDHKTALQSGQNAVIRSIIPFTEAPSLVQFNDENIESEVASENSKSNKKQATLNPPTTLKLKKDVKLSSKHPYYGWPYIFHNPQIYEPLEDTSDLEKAKDKRYSQDVIPLHMNIPNSSSDNQLTLLPSRYAQDADNPIFGDQAFFSFILNDYFDKSIEDDPTISKDLHWGKEFDSEFSARGGDTKRIRRLENDRSKDSIETSTVANLVTKNSMEDERSGGDSYKVKEKVKYSGTCKGFKDFVEKFAQKFGSKNYEKGAKPLMSEEQNSIQSQPFTNRKNEFQEASELLDELVTSYTNGQADEKDTFMTTIKEFEEFLNAHETPSMFNVPGELGKQATSNLSRYRHAAKNAALVNNADYIDTSEYAV